VITGWPDLDARATVSTMICSLLARLPNRQTIILQIFLLLLPAASACASNIAVISRANILPYDLFIEGFQEASGKNSSKDYTVKIFYSDPSKKNSEEHIVADVAAFKPDILIAVGSNSVILAQRCCPGVPLIYSMIIDSHALAREKKADQCGIIMAVDMNQRLEVLQELNTSAQRIGTVYNPAESGEQLKELRQAAADKNLKLDAVPVSSSRDALPAIEAVIGRVDAFMLLFDRSILVPQVLEFLFSCSFRSKVPVIGISEKYTSLGALFSVEYDIKDLGRETWRHTAEVLAGADVCAGLEKPAAFLKIVINKTIAKKMGITIPESMSTQGSFVD
jgi:putative tryptophan/tyrosine transport system substrate-binding protein